MQFNRWAEAEPLLVEQLEIMRNLPADQPEVLDTKKNLAVVYWGQGKLDQSIPLFEEVLRIRERTLGRKDPTTLNIIANLGVNYRDAGRLADAIVLLEEAHEAVKDQPGTAWIATALADAIAPHGLVLLGEGRWDAAEPLLRKCLAIRENQTPEDWRTFNTQSMLGGALLGQRRYADAEPLLLAGHRGMVEREAAIPPPGRPRVAEAIERLMRLYEAQGNEREAATWRARLEAVHAAESQPASRPGK
jgi:tetratricopeptide (TPR) repeat protein